MAGQTNNVIACDTPGNRTDYVLCKTFDKPAAFTGMRGSVWHGLERRKLLDMLAGHTRPFKSELTPEFIRMFLAAGVKTRVLPDGRVEVYESERGRDTVLCVYRTVEPLELYNGTTAARLDHYFGNTVAIARLQVTAGLLHGGVQLSAEEMAQLKAKFIGGLESTIKEGLPEWLGVRNTSLAEMVQLAKSTDWSTVAGIKALYEQYYAVRPERSKNIEGLFANN